MVNNHAVALIDVALAEAQIIDSIENIGLSHAIVAYEAIHFGRELQSSFLDVFEI